MELLSKISFNDGLLIVAACSLLLNTLALTYIVSRSRMIQRESSILSREMFGSLKKIEGLTANKREQVLLQYDKLIESLTSRIPAQVAARASDAIFEAESKILTRLAEIESTHKTDEEENEADKAKFDELIKSLEGLESTVVALTARAVHQVMLESRSELFVEQGRPPFQ